MKMLGATQRNGDVVHPRIHAAMAAADNLHLEMTAREVPIVHVMDGKHHKGSRHYVGLAFDMRIWYLDSPQAFAEELQRILGIHYDVVLEKTHIHVEYDPKYPSL